MITYLRNAYVGIIQISYYSDRTILSYKESARFTGTTLVSVSFITDKDLHVIFECLTNVFFITDSFPDGFCSDNILCKDANSVCSSGICQCTGGFRNIDGECREGNDNTLLAGYMMF